MTGDDISTLRKKADMSQAALAKLLFVSASALSRWEALGPKRVKTDDMRIGIFAALVALPPERLSELHQEAITHGELYAVHLALKELYK